MATRKPAPKVSRRGKAPFPPKRVEQLVIKCERGTNTNADLAPGLPAYYSDRLLVLVNPHAVRRPDPLWPLGLPPVIMKALLKLKQSHGLIRVETIVETGFRFYLPPASSSPEGLSPAGKAELNAIVMPLKPGELPAFLPGSVPGPAAIEMASRIQLIFSGPAKVQEAAQYLACAVPNIMRVQRPAYGYASPISAEYPPSDPDLKTAAAYVPDWWRRMSGNEDGSLPIDDSGLGIIDNIAVLDSGVAKDHPSLDQAVYFPTPGDFPYQPEDTYGHGTHVTSIIAGRPTGISVTSDSETMNMPAGVLPNAKVLSFRIFKDIATSSVSMTKLKSALFAIRYYYPQIKVINMSIWMLGLPDWDLRDEIQKLDALGIVVCACSGNKFSGPSNPNDICADSSYRVLYPARLSKVVSVGSVDKGSARAWFSRFSTRGNKGWDGNDFYALSEGRWPLVDIIAPGCVIWGAMIKMPHQDMMGATNLVYSGSGVVAAWLNGTSMATPMVTAAVGYLRGKWPNATAQEIRKAISLCADTQDIPWPPKYPAGFPVDRSELHGTGVLDFGQVATWAAKTPQDL